MVEVLGYPFPPSHVWMGGRVKNGYNLDTPWWLLTDSLFRLDGSSGSIAFGASQCVLVRNETSKTSLPPELQKALVLTIEQSKSRGRADFH